MVGKTGEVVDGGHYGRWKIGHGHHGGHWDRSTPENSRPPSATAAHQHIAQVKQQAVGKFVPGGLPFETTYQRVMAREEPPRFFPDVGRHSQLISTSSGIVLRHACGRAPGK